MRRDPGRSRTTVAKSLNKRGLTEHSIRQAGLMMSLLDRKIFDDGFLPMNSGNGRARQDEIEDKD